MLQLVDTHCHADHPLIESKYMYVEDARRADIKRLVIAPITYDSNYTSMELYPKEQYPDVLFAKGLHPKYAYNVPLWDEKTVGEFKRLIESDDRIVAVKTGVDFSKKNLQPQQIQRQFDFLSMFADIAYEYDLPIVLHVRDAAEEMLDYMKKTPLKGAVEFHCYNYDFETMKRFIEAVEGYCYFGIGGKVTYDEAEDLQEAVKNMDLSRILLESDAPFVKCKGEISKINTSDHALPAVAEKIAVLKGISLDDVVKQTYDNACRFFRIS